MKFLTVHTVLLNKLEPVHFLQFFFYSERKLSNKDIYNFTKDFYLKCCSFELFIPQRILKNRPNVLVSTKIFSTLIIRVYSHLSCLVRLNRTQFRFPLWCGSFGQVCIQQSHPEPAEEVVSVRFQTNTGTVEWMKQWMDDLKHTCGFVYSFWFTCKKGSVKANSTKKKKKNQHCIWSGPKQVN